MTLIDGEYAKYAEGIAGGGMENVAVLSGHAQTIAAEAMEYTRRSVEDGGRLVEALSCAKSAQDVIDIHARYLRQSYEAFVSEARSIGELYADLARDAYKPFESMVVAAR